MSSARFFPAHAVGEAFPFHLWLDAELRVVQVGPALRRVVPSLAVGVPALESLALVCPDVLPTAVTLREHRDQPFVLSHPPSGLRLRGQLMVLDDGFVLLISPGISDADELPRWGLTLDDFPIHTAMAEQLGMIRELRASVSHGEQQRRALLESQHRIATHLHHMPLAVIDWDIQGRVVAWNPAAAKIFGLGAEQVIGAGVEVLGLLGPSESKQGLEASEPAECFDLLATLDRRVVIEHRTRAGATVLCAWHNTRIDDDDGNPIGVSSILRDVTESVRAERAMRETQKLESLGLLAGGVAHDFNNLLTAVLGNAELAQCHADPDSMLARHLCEITTITERATELTKQLLDYSGRATYELEPLSLAELVTQMRGILAVALADDVRLVVHQRGELPRISGAPSQLRRVIMNLVVNATEAIGDRGGEIRVTTGVVSLTERLEDPSLRDGPLEPGCYVRLEVGDDGVGMSPELLARIFDPFFSTKFTGRGLGLASILGIVRIHRGALRVESEPGRGTRFEVWFPALEPVVEPGVVASTVSPARSGKCRLLVVDDEAQVRRILTTALSGAGFDVVAAAAGNAALELYDNDPGGFDLVLTDLTMPGLDGHELFVALTARDPRLPVILSSGYSDNLGTATYPDGTPATFLKKPYRLGHLLAKVHEELGKRLL